ncbi:MAG: hypothetical protein QM496_07700 [Verrucomicrobiota bacterium]
MKEKNKDTFDQVMEQARAYREDTSRSEFGFDTRVMAHIAQLREGDYGSLAEYGDAGAFLTVFSSWIWRSAAGLTPVVAAAVLLCVFWFGFSIPADAHSFVNHVTGYLPYNPF